MIIYLEANQLIFCEVVDYGAKSVGLEVGELSLRPGWDAYCLEKKTPPPQNVRFFQYKWRTLEITPNSTECL